MRPDAIPVRGAGSQAVLPPGVVAALFGEGVRLRGTERVRIPASGTGDVVLQAIAGTELVLELSRTDSARLGRPPHRLVGPRGSVEAPEPRLVKRELVLPAGLLRSWGLSVGQAVAVQVASVIFVDVVVAEGEPRLSVDEADLVAAGAETGVSARLRRDIAVEPALHVADGQASLGGRLITENDVRQARLKGHRITVRPGQKITPAAASLGKELGNVDFD